MNKNGLLISFLLTNGAFWIEFVSFAFVWRIIIELGERKGGDKKKYCIFTCSDEKSKEKETESGFVLLLFNSGCKGKN